ncbi:DUF397 domain-containing protein [Streptomyces sp. Q6]|uniref:DUF397 domain-containing protein n=1 Tax=Streptomyces citrinus TaxID=3118173 RepID=A0ACD5AF31_9ACTN
MSTDPHWFKSSYSGDQGECLEAALQWTKSSYSGGEGECLEAAATPHHIHLRDSKHTPDTSPTFKVTAAAWAAFLGSLA